MTDDTATWLENLVEVASGDCPPCVDGPCFVRPCGYHCKYPYTDDSTMWVGNCPDCRRRGAIMRKLGSLDHATVLAAALRALDVAHDFCCDFEEDRPCTEDNCQVQCVFVQADELRKAYEVHHD